MAKPIIVTISDHQTSRINEIAKKLRQMGMHVEQILSTTGIISGSSEESTIRKIRQVPGVATVEEDFES